MKKVIIAILIIFLGNMTIGECKADTIKIRVSPDILDFYVEDINGKISGYTDTQLLLQIPYMDAYWSTGEVNEANPTLFQKWNELYTSNSEALIPPGKYKLVVYGTGLTTATPMMTYIDIVWNQKGSVRVGYGDTIFPGIIYTYEFNIPATPPANNNFVFIKVAQSSDLIKDINAMSKVGYIGNQKFVSELIKDINEIEAEKAKGKVDDGLTPTQKAKKEYEELLNEITKKYNKFETDEFIKQEAYIIIRKDLDYIINHL